MDDEEVSSSFEEQEEDVDWTDEDAAWKKLDSAVEVLRCSNLEGSTDNLVEALYVIRESLLESLGYPIDTTVPNDLFSRGIVAVLLRILQNPRAQLLVVEVILSVYCLLIKHDGFGEIRGEMINLNMEQILCNENRHQVLQQAVEIRCKLAQYSAALGRT
jgi:hypothetical protein